MDRNPRAGDCPACGKDSPERFTVMQRKGSFPLVRCGGCGLVRMENPPPPRPPAAQKAHPVLETFSPGLNWLKTQVILKPEVRRFRPFLKNGGPVLDVGCGTGWSASLWKEYGGVEVHGVEFQPAWADLAARRFGLKVWKGRFEEVDIPSGTYELVILRHVLEHFPKTEPILEKIHEVLKPGGYALIIVPNADSLGRRLFGRFWAWGAPAHIYNFSSGPLSLLLRKAGLGRPRVYHSPSPVLMATSLNNWLRNGGLAWLADFFGDGSLILNLLLFPLALAGLAMGKSEVITVLSQKEI